jgi:excisionase family DNA binding protein
MAFQTRQMIKRTEITIETNRVLIIRRRRGFIRGWCEGCLAEVQMFTPSEAATLASVSSRTIYRWIEEAKLHFFEEFRGSLLVCSESLRANDRSSIENYK